MYFKSIIRLVILAATVMSLSCQSPLSNDEEILTEEAKLAALWLSDEPVVPHDLAQELQQKYVQMRAEYESEFPNVNLSFRFPAEPGVIYIRMHYPYRLQFMAGHYHEWDELNEKYDVSEIVIDEESYMPSKLIFEDQVNTFVLSEMYENLVGIKSASAMTYEGDGPNVYPWMVGDEIVFLVRWAAGDCPSGCIDNHFWYFKSNESGIEFIGEFCTGQPRPSWWQEIEPAVCKYFHREPGNCDMFGGFD